MEHELLEILRLAAPFGAVVESCDRAPEEAVAIRVLVMLPAPQENDPDAHKLTPIMRLRIRKIGIDTGSGLGGTYPLHPTDVAYELIPRITDIQHRLSRIWSHLLTVMYFAAQEE